MKRLKNLNFLDKYYSRQDKKTRLLIALSLIGIIIFLLFSATLPFKDKLFSLLYPKPSSKADEGFNLTITGLNASNNIASLNGYDFSWNAGTFALTDGAYAVLFVTTRDEGGNIVDQHWLVGSQATEGLYFNGSYTFPMAGTAIITVWETNKVDCVNFSCNPNLAIHNSNAFTVPRIISTPTPTPSPTPIISPAPSPTSTLTPTPTPTSPPAQQYGAITGTVSSVGGTVPGTKIVIRVGKTNRTYYSNTFGVYSIPNLPPGSYNLAFSAKGYVNQTASISVTANSITTKNVTMVKR